MGRRQPTVVRERQHSYVVEKSPLVVIDTSAWIQVLRRAGGPCVIRVDELMESHRARFCGVVSGELLQGARHDSELEFVRRLIRMTPHLWERPGLWSEAGELGWRLRRKGKTIGILDCYLGVLARDHGAGILTQDRHFGVIALELGTAVEIL